MCVMHSDKWNLKNRQKRVDDNARRYKERVAQGRCPRCGIPLLPEETVWCSGCLTKGVPGTFHGMDTAVMRRVYAANNQESTNEL